MFNPWILLAVVLAFAASNAGSFLYGQHVEAGQEAKAREKAVTAAITAHEEQTAEDMATAYEVGLAKGRARTAAASNRESFNNALSAAPRRPDACDMPRAAYDRLLDAVSLANADEGSTVVVPKPVSKPAAALVPPRGR